MNKKYVVRLTDEERAVCEATVKNQKGKSEKLRRAVILLKADVDGPGCSDGRISEAIGCRIRTVENVRPEFVLLPRPDRFDPSPRRIREPGGRPRPSPSRPAAHDRRSASLEGGGGTGWSSRSLGAEPRTYGVVSGGIPSPDRPGE